MFMTTNKALRPKCDFCKAPATYDTQTVLGPWAHVCDRHFERYSTKLPGLFSLLAVEHEDTKTCWLCAKTKPIDEFYSYTDACGKLRYRGECKKCNLQERKNRRLRGY